MPVVAKLLLSILSDSVVQQLVLAALRNAAGRTDNTIDDAIVGIVKDGLANRVNPIQRATQK